MWSVRLLLLCLVWRSLSAQSQSLSHWDLPATPDWEPRSQDVGRLDQSSSQDEFDLEADATFNRAGRAALGGEAVPVKSEGLERYRREEVVPSDSFSARIGTFADLLPDYDEDADEHRPHFGAQQAAWGRAQRRARRQVVAAENSVEEQPSKTGVQLASLKWRTPSFRSPDSSTPVGDNVTLTSPGPTHGASSVQQFRPVIFVPPPFPAAGRASGQTLQTPQGAPAVVYIAGQPVKITHVASVAPADPETPAPQPQQPPSQPQSPPQSPQQQPSQQPLQQPAQQPSQQPLQQPSLQQPQQQPQSASPAGTSPPSASPSQPGPISPPPESPPQPPIMFQVAQMSEAATQPQPPLASPLPLPLPPVPQAQLSAQAIGDMALPTFNVMSSVLRMDDYTLRAQQPAQPASTGAAQNAASTASLVTSGNSALTAALVNSSAVGGGQSPFFLQWYGAPGVVVRAPPGYPLAGPLTGPLAASVSLAQNPRMGPTIAGIPFAGVQSLPFGAHAPFIAVRGAGPPAVNAVASMPLPPTAMARAAARAHPPALSPAAAKGPAAVARGSVATASGGDGRENIENFGLGEAVAAVVPEVVAGAGADESYTEKGKRLGHGSAATQTDSGSSMSSVSVVLENSDTASTETATSEGIASTEVSENSSGASTASSSISTSALEDHACSADLQEDTSREFEEDVRDFDEELSGMVGGRSVRDDFESDVALAEMDMDMDMEASSPAGRGNQQQSKAELLRVRRALNKKGTGQGADGALKRRQWLGLEPEPALSRMVNAVPRNPAIAITIGGRPSSLQTGAAAVAAERASIPLDSGAARERATNGMPMVENLHAARKKVEVLARASIRGSQPEMDLTKGAKSIESSLQVSSPGSHPIRKSDDHQITPQQLEKLVPFLPHNSGLKSYSSAPMQPMIDAEAEAAVAEAAAAAAASIRQPMSLKKPSPADAPSAVPAPLRPTASFPAGAPSAPDVAMAPPSVPSTAGLSVKQVALNHVAGASNDAVHNALAAKLYEVQQNVGKVADAGVIDERAGLALPPPAPGTADMSAPSLGPSHLHKIGSSRHVSPLASNPPASPPPSNVVWRVTAMEASPTSPAAGGGGQPQGAPQQAVQPQQAAAAPLRAASPAPPAPPPPPSPSAPAPVAVAAPGLVPGLTPVLAPGPLQASAPAPASVPAPASSPESAVGPTIVIAPAVPAMSAPQASAPHPEGGVPQEVAIMVPTPSPPGLPPRAVLRDGARSPAVAIAAIRGSSSAMEAPEDAAIVPASVATAVAPIAAVPGALLIDAAAAPEASERDATASDATATNTSASEDVAATGTRDDGEGPVAGGVGRCASHAGDHVALVGGPELVALDPRGTHWVLPMAGIAGQHPGVVRIDVNINDAPANVRHQAIDNGIGSNGLVVSSEEDRAESNADAGGGDAAASVGAEGGGGGETNVIEANGDLAERAEQREGAAVMSVNEESSLTDDDVPAAKDPRGRRPLHAPREYASAPLSPLQTLDDSIGAASDARAFAYPRVPDRFTDAAAQEETQKDSIVRSASTEAESGTQEEASVSRARGTGDEGAGNKAADGGNRGANSPNAAANAASEESKSGERVFDRASDRFSDASQEEMQRIFMKQVSARHKTASANGGSSVLRQQRDAEVAMDTNERGSEGWYSAAAAAAPPAAPEASEDDEDDEGTFSHSDDIGRRNEEADRETKASGSGDRVSGLCNGKPCKDPKESDEVLGSRIQGYDEKVEKQGKAPHKQFKTISHIRDNLREQGSKHKINGNCIVERIRTNQNKQVTAASPAVSCFASPNAMSATAESGIHDDSAAEIKGAAEFDEKVELQKALAGDLARRIVESVLRKAQTEGQVQQHFVLSAEGASDAAAVLDAERRKQAREQQALMQSEHEVLGQVIELLDGLARRTGREQACTRLSPELHGFLVWLLQRGPGADLSALDDPLSGPPGETAAGAAQHPGAFLFHSQQEPQRQSQHRNQEGISRSKSPQKPMQQERVPPNESQRTLAKSRQSQSQLDESDQEEQLPQKPTQAPQGSKHGRSGHRSMQADVKDPRWMELEERERTLHRLLEDLQRLPGAEAAAAERGVGGGSGAAGANAESWLRDEPFTSASAVRYARADRSSWLEAAEAAEEALRATASPQLFAQPLQPLQFLSEPSTPSPAALSAQHWVLADAAKRERAGEALERGRRGASSWSFFEPNAASGTGEREHSPTEAAAAAAAEARVWAAEGDGLTTERRRRAWWERRRPRRRPRGGPQWPTDEYTRLQALAARIRAQSNLQ